MASHFVFLFLALAIYVQGETSEVIECEQLNLNTCAFAVSSAGKRCVLEKYVKMRNGEEAYSCTTSEIDADEKVKGLVETNECVNACGVDRRTFGISTDSLIESGFITNLCAPKCYDSCPNIIDLYFNLAAAEGVYLPKLCEEQSKSQRRKMYEKQYSSDKAAAAPIKAVKYYVKGPMKGAYAPVSY